MKYVLLDNIRSAFNVGSIFRTCDGAGIDKLFLCGLTAYPPNIKLEKTALGTTNTVEWEYKNDSEQTIKELKDKEVYIVSAESMKNSENYTLLSSLKKKDICIVLGHELIGVGERILQLSDTVISIPMLGSKTSLNVGVSAGILIYELIKN